MASSPLRFAGAALAIVAGGETRTRGQDDPGEFNSQQETKLPDPNASDIRTVGHSARKSNWERFIVTRDTLIKFGKVENADASDLPGWVVVEGTPTMKTAVQHTTEDGKVLSGTWQATPGTYHATYTDYEFVHMIAGRIIITPDGGDPVEVGPGDAFVVEADFKGTWKIVEPVTKHFVVTVGS